MVNNLLAIDNVNAQNVTISKPKIDNTVELTSVFSPNGIIISHKNGLKDPRKQFILRISSDMFYGQYGIKEIQLNPFYKKICEKCEKCKKCEECKKIKLEATTSTSTMKKTPINNNIYIIIIILLILIIVGIYLFKK